MSSGFHFGAPASTGTSAGSIFGTSSGTTSSGGNLFGGGNAGSTSTGFSFGQTPTNTTGEATKPLFGAAPAQTSGGNLFGQPPGGGGTSSSGGGFSFGKKPEETSSTNPGPATTPFAGFGTPGKSTPTTSGPSLFGSTTPAPSTSSANFFGNPSTTPAGPPPTTSSFGASTGGAAMFGQSKPAQEGGAKAAGFSFGKPADPPTTTNSAATQSAPAANMFQPTTTSGNLFGSKPATAGGFSFGAPSKPVEKPAEPTASAPAAPSGQKPLFSFGAPSTSDTSKTTSSGPSLFAPAPTSTTSSSTPSLFAPASATPQPASPQPTAPLFGAAPTGPSSLFSKPVAPAASSDSSKPSPFSFPGTSSQPTSTSAPAAASAGPKPLFGAAPTTSASSSGPSLFAPPASSQTAPSTTTSTAAPSNAQAPAAGGFSFGATPAGTAPQPLTTKAADPKLTASTAGPVPPAQSRLRNKTMDEILTRWATDLTRYTKEFKGHAETVARWDQLIVDNSSKIDKLYVKTRTCEKQTMSVEMQLAAVENQQTELEGWLTKYENDVEEMLAKEGSTPNELGGPDQDRERTYKLAEKLGERLDDMGHDLESMVEEVNAANASLSKAGKADEPITQIVRILNSHLTQLQAIDQGTLVLQAKVAEAQKAAQGVGYLNGSTTGEGRAAVEDFYRSYMGRR